MWKEFIEFFSAILNDPVRKNDMDAYINAGNPKNSGDVERLEREFQIQRHHLSRSWGE